MADTEDGNVAIKRKKIMKTADVSMRTTVFVLSHTPYRATLELPHRSRFSKQEVAEAAQRAGCRSLMSLPTGYFDVIRVDDNNCQIAVYRFEKVVGCRKTDSNRHAKLPVAFVRHKEIKLLNMCTVRLGFKYLYGYNQTYEVISNGSILLSQNTPNEPLPSLNEHQRTVDMLFALRSAVGQNYTIVCSSDSRGHYSPFSGGGDITIFKKGSAAAATLLHTKEELEEELGTSAQSAHSPQSSSPINVTPPKVGEYRCASIENKVAHVQGDKDVTLQLQANMLLLCSTLLIEILNKSNADGIEVLSCYGIQIGITYPLKILKLTIDFSKDKVLYEELFSLSPCAFYPVYVDMCMEYILQSLTLS